MNSRLWLLQFAALEEIMRGGPAIRTPHGCQRSVGVMLFVPLDRPGRRAIHLGVLFTAGRRQDPRLVQFEMLAGVIHRSEKMDDSIFGLRGRTVANRPETMIAARSPHG